MVTIIELKGPVLGQFETEYNPNYIVGLNKINIFIGINNSGKSRLLRCLFSDENNINYIDLFNNDKNKVSSISMNIRRIIDGANDQARTNKMILKNENQLNKYVDLIHKISEETSAVIPKFIDFLYNINNESFALPERYNSNTLIRVIAGYKEAITAINTNLLSFKKNTANLKKIYIPILRGLRPIQYSNNRFINDDSYLKRTKLDYFQSDNIKYQIYTGLSIYEDVMKYLLGDENERKIISEFENFLSENIFNQRVNLIPKYKDDVLHIKLGEDKQFEVYNLGDGLQTIISILFPIFLSKDEANMVFIEEPESHLHPEWQILLISALKKFPKNQYFITTHSSSFINDPNSSLYIIKKKNDKSSIIHANLESNKVALLKDLGYKPSDLFQSNFILWVEGPSDKIYINYWINKMAPSLKEGQHYTIMFYGGNTYEHFLKEDGEFDLRFLKTINQNFGIVVDSDRSKKGEVYNYKKKQIQELFEKHSSYCWLTKYREIENYIPLDVFENAVKVVHDKKNIVINKGEYEDRCTVIDNSSPNSYRAKITIPESIFKVVQKNGDGTTKGVKSNDLRKGIEDALKSTKKNTFSIDKIKVSKEIMRIKG